MVDIPLIQTIESNIADLIEVGNRRHRKPVLFLILVRMRMPGAHE